MSTIGKKLARSMALENKANIDREVEEYESTGGT
jgi:hypothetical protein